MRPTPFYAPDGFASGRHSDAAVRRYEGAAEGVATTDRVIEAILAHERHDDGLVHSHGWAQSEMMTGPSRRALRAGHRSDQQHDDGLVHGHDWASARATPAPRPRGNNWGLPLVMLARRSEDWHDDGLVHNHDWAVSAK